jgi:hypothetical protein
VLFESAGSVAARLAVLVVVSQLPICQSANLILRTENSTYILYTQHKRPVPPGHDAARTLLLSPNQTLLHPLLLLLLHSSHHNAPAQ